MEELNQSIQKIIEKQINNGVEFNIKLAITTINNLKNELDFNNNNNNKSKILKIKNIQTYLKYCDKYGIIRNKININGTTTGRFTQTEPNLAGVNKEPIIRKLFKTNIGIDAKQLELRLLAHYLYNLDNGEYTNQILNSDIHTYNMNKAGLNTRDEAKVFIYTLNYGGGEKLIAEKLNCSINDSKKYIDNFKNLKGLKELKNNLPTKLFNRFDIKYNGDYKDLNKLLQSSGSIVMKVFLHILNKKLIENKIDFKFVLNVHDEIQITSGDTDSIIKIVKESELLLTKSLKLNCKIEFDCKIGNNWSETH